MKSIRMKWIVGVAALVVMLLPLILYVYQFGNTVFPPDFSNSTDDWANFGAYLSGTVGVVAVVGTLISVLITLKQQQAMIENQERERLIKESYSIATVVFPELRNRLDGFLQSSISNFLSKNNFPVPEGLDGAYGGKCIIDLLNSFRAASEGFVTFNAVFPEDEAKGGLGVKAALLLRLIESNLRVVCECAGNAPELGDYLYEESLQDLFGCYLAYKRGISGDLDKDFLYQCRVAGVPYSVGDNHGLNKLWFDLGKRVAKPAV